VSIFVEPGARRSMAGGVVIFRAGIAQNHAVDDSTAASAAYETVSGAKLRRFFAASATFLLDGKLVDLLDAKQFY
jgi:hypothetical protein